MQNISPQDRAALAQELDKLEAEERDPSALPAIERLLQLMAKVGGQDFSHLPASFKSVSENKERIRHEMYAERPELEALHDQLHAVLCAHGCPDDARLVLTNVLVETVVIMAPSNCMQQEKGLQEYCEGVTGELCEEVTQTMLELMTAFEFIK